MQKVQSKKQSFFALVSSHLAGMYVCRALVALDQLERPYNQAVGKDFNFEQSRFSIFDGR
jgi:hypothetical protein